MAAIRSRPDELMIGKQSRRRFHWVRVYAEAKPGTLVALPSSNGFLEVAIAPGECRPEVGRADRHSRHCRLGQMITEYA